MQKILVANRGEIALRVMRTAREMGIATVAVFSEADRTAPFVQYADEAYCIGPAPSSQSYLRGDTIIEVALKTGTEGIHPGYGFLSENADFARAVTEAGITFIGPKPHAIEVMGDKLKAKETVSGYDIPLVPGTEHAIEDPQEAMAVARRIGFPILIKASAGGGGKGMRVVEREEDLQEQMNRAISEAISAFGDGAVFIEKFVTKPRHIEIQIMADSHGNVRHLFERECSIQRRHQKVIEEAPSAVLTPELREAMGNCAMDVARACDYVGAGTVEFLLDADHNFYFLEMNTRLQVEHPVSELISGIDLVREQIEVARGKEVSFEQEDLEIIGHSIEARVYAEDPRNNFLPDIGTLHTYRRPQGSGVRVDDGLEEGMEIPIHYDPMIAKLVVHAETRDAAIERLVRAIDDYRISGVRTTLEFCRYAVQHEAFRSGDFDTHFVKNHFDPENLPVAEDLEAIAALAAVLGSETASESAGSTAPSTPSLWRTSRR